MVPLYIRLLIGRFQVRILVAEPAWAPELEIGAVARALGVGDEVAAHALDV